MMKELKVFGAKKVNSESSAAEISGLLNGQDKQEIGNVPWPEYPYRPDAHFTIAYGSDCIFLKYFISEKELRAANSQPNSPVYQDSCVEFFVSFNNGTHYYNFEINCIGTILAAYGPDRANRAFLPEPVIQTIKTFITIDKLNKAGFYNWELIAVIPLSSFIHDEFDSIQGIRALANFFKCGDMLKDPHYLSWNEINTSEPDFHRPEFFGNLLFE
ncbi:MAG: hypothetical protein EOO04_22490 [Chitinophagaceae bacterium]|nr:MAG: hypothetical protein EOO04_22490 [Chitinophagaceae bacterium]